ncbi:MAG: hypothetical protein ACREOI_13335 [bacterium]
MPWKTYFLRYRLVSPLHIGAPALGNVQRTLYYLPGKTLWGAATAMLTRRFINQLADQHYQKVGKFVEENIRFGYFFPEQNGQRFLPRLVNGQFFCGNLTKEEFEYRFLVSEASTAIEPTRFAQADGTLHETEYLFPKSLQGQPAPPLYFSGYLYLQQERLGPDDDVGALKQANDRDLMEMLCELFIGANRRMGAGKLLREGKVPDAEEGGNLPLPTPGPNDWSLPCPYLASHLKCAPNFEKAQEKILGPIQPLVERIWAPSKNSRRGPGQDITTAVIAWAPGARVLDEKLAFGVAAYGRWEVM